MIFSAFNLLVNQLDAYIKSITNESEVIMANIATIDAYSGNNDSGNDHNRKIILSLVNIEEEATLKNQIHYNRLNQIISYQNAPVFLNLYMLATAHYDTYDVALRRLSNVIQFFQGKCNFSLKNSPFDLKEDEAENIELFLDLFSLTFEQLNHLWGSLGGKQWPSALYKIRLVRMSENRITGFGTLIEKIRTIEKAITTP